MVYTEIGDKNKKKHNYNQNIEIKKSTLLKYSIYLVVLILFISVLFGSFYQINAGERGYDDDVTSNPEIAKKYGTGESSAFINGVLGTIFHGKTE